MTSMYKNILLVDTLNIIKYYAYNHNKILDSVKCINNHQVHFNCQFYRQINSIAMGGPTSSTTAEIYLQSHEQTVILTALHPEKVWERFATAVYFLLKRTYHIDNLHRNIKFTMVDVSNEELAFVYTLLK